MKRALRYRLCLVCAVLAGCSLADEAAAATRPTATAASLPPAGTVEAGLAFTADEMTILSAIRDRSSQLDEQGLFVLLSRAAALPQLSRQEFDKIAPAEIGRLLADPDAMRCRPMRLRLRVFKAEKWMPGLEIGKSPRWPADHPVWYLTGLDNTGSRPTKLPVIVLSAADPSAILGRPQRIGAGGEMLYPTGPNIELAGVFYKVFTGPSIDQQKAASQSQPAPASDYPVVVCWQIMPAPQLISDESKEIAGIILAGLALFASYIYVRRRINALRQAK